MPTDPRIADVIETANEALQNMAIRHAVYISRVANGQAKAILRFLDHEVYPEMAAEVVRRLSRMTKLNPALVFTREEYKALVEGIDKIAKEGMRNAGALLRGDLKELASHEAKWQAAILEQASPIALGVAAPNVPMIHAAIRSRPIWWCAPPASNPTRISLTAAASRLMWAFWSTIRWRRMCPAYSPPETLPRGRISPPANRKCTLSSPPPASTA